MNQLQSDYWIMSPPFFVFMKSQFLRPIANDFITSRSQTYPQFGIIRRTGGERFRDGKEELTFQLFREGSRDCWGPRVLPSNPSMASSLITYCKLKLISKVKTSNLKKKN